MRSGGDATERVLRAEETKEIIDMDAARRRYSPSQKCCQAYPLHATAITTNGQHFSS